MKLGYIVAGLILLVAILGIFMVYKPQDDGYSTTGKAFPTKDGIMVNDILIRDRLFPTGTSRDDYEDKIITVKGTVKVNQEDAEEEGSNGEIVQKRSGTWKYFETIKSITVK